MTKKSFIAIPLCAFGAALLAAPVVADQQMTVTGERQSAYQERVSIAGLDLTRWSAQRALRRSVHSASERVCIQAEGPLDANEAGFRGAPSCTTRTYLEAGPQIAAAIDRARSGQLMATNLVISITARAR